MNNYRSAQLISLGSFAGAIAKAIGQSAGNGYPVLGAEGSCFFVEIATGPRLQRTILKTIHIGFGTSALPTDMSDADDILVDLPDASYLVALLSLLQSALCSEAMVLHPLDEQGNFHKDWRQAVTAASPDVLP